MIAKATTTFMLVSLAMAPMATAFACDDASSAARFSDNDGVGLIDETTGLVWQSCLAGQSTDGHACGGDPLLLSWLDVEAFPSEQAGDWRLLTLEELGTLIDPSCKNGALPAVFGVDRSRQIWTASPGFPVHDVAAVIDLDTGMIWGVGKGVKRHFFLVADDPG